MTLCDKWGDFRHGPLIRLGGGVGNALALSAGDPCSSLRPSDDFSLKLTT